MTCLGIKIPMTLNCWVLQYPLKVAEEFLYPISFYIPNSQMQQICDFLLYERFYMKENVIPTLQRRAGIVIPYLNPW